MTISIELRTDILRLYQAEHWRVGTIATQLHLHRDTVTRVLAGASVLVLSARPRPRQIDVYLPFIRETLSKYPSLTASRLHVMVQERGYSGAGSHFRHLVATLRPECVNDFATPCFMNFRCRVVLFQSAFFALAG